MCAEPRDSATIEQLCGLHRPAQVVHWTLFALKLSFKVVKFYLPQDLQTGIFLLLMKFSANPTVCIGR